ncbi:hypothetical protein [Rhodanobacter sp. C05]|uniref:hypothetical protein n=1 Tax=Rhodanobacter sp. C05 TaxID=1945855 RepID=UPI00117A8496|nr:hypothetical protein [Rhodanobacter sp. C05]
MKVPLTLILIAFSFTGSAWATQPAVPRAAKPSISVPQTEVECKAHGGNWGALGLFSVGCNVKTTDSGKICSNSNDCQGVCLAPAGSGNGDKAKGTCSAYTADFGRTSRVEHGKAVWLNVE